MIIINDSVQAYVTSHENKFSLVSSVVVSPTGGVIVRQILGGVKVDVAFELSSNVLDENVNIFINDPKAVLHMSILLPDKILYSYTVVYKDNDIIMAELRQYKNGTVISVSV